MDFLNKITQSVENADAVTLGCGLLLGLGLRSKYVLGGMWQKMSAFKFLPASVAASHYKLVLIVRNDLQMGKGKMCAQCSHASVIASKMAVLKNPLVAKKWEMGGQEKIVVQTDSEDSLLKLAAEAGHLGLLTNIVKDTGRTEVAPGTKTVLAVGPGLKSEIDKVTSHLKLL